MAYNDEDQLLRDDLLSEDEGLVDEDEDLESGGDRATNTFGETVDSSSDHPDKAEVTEDEAAQNRTADAATIDDEIAADEDEPI